MMKNNIWFEDDPPDICSHCMSRMFLLYIAHNANFLRPNFFSVPGQIYHHIVDTVQQRMKCAIHRIKYAMSNSDLKKGNMISNMQF